MPSVCLYVCRLKSRRTSVQAQIYPCWEDEPDAEREAGCLLLSVEAVKSSISFLVLTTSAVNE